MYYNARYYLPKLRRFVSADTIVPNAISSQNFNRYSYVRNNPVNFIDPSGHVACPPGVTNFECNSAGNTPSAKIGKTGVESTTQIENVYGGVEDIFDEFIYFSENEVKWEDIPESVQDSLKGSGIDEVAWDEEVLGGGNVRDIGGTIEDPAVWLIAIITAGRLGPGVAAGIEEASLLVYTYLSSNLFALCAANPFCATVLLGLGQTAAQAVCSDGDCTNEAKTIVPKIGQKAEYAFGNATGSAHNVQRSIANRDQLASIGIYDNAAGRSYLTNIWTTTVNNPNNISRVQENGRIVRDTLLVGPDGFLKMETIWEDITLITFYFYGSGGG